MEVAVVILFGGSALIFFLKKYDGSFSTEMLARPIVQVLMNTSSGFGFYLPNNLFGNALYISF